MDPLALFHGPNAGYILDLYDRYHEDPSSVDDATRTLFSGLPVTPEPSDATAALPPPSPTLAPPRAPTLDTGALVDAVRLAHNIRVRGHLAARLDPLGSAPQGDPGLDPETFGLGLGDLAALPPEVVGGPLAVAARNGLEALEALRRIYCGTTGYDYGHLQSADERAWLHDAVQSGRYAAPLSPEAKLRLLERLTQVEGFESYLHRAFPGQKRFSIEGTDMLVPMLDQIIQSAAAAGAREIVMGMAHRGRLNVLAHILHKPYQQIFAEFEAATSGEGPAATEGINRGWTGDVKYHLGFTDTLADGDAGRIMLSLAPNPSHLEFVNPVVEGMTRAAQERREAAGPVAQDNGRALPLLIHGDAAFPGEGVVAETLNLSRLAGYQTGGTVHIITNNQLGFTTEPHEARSTVYASDLAKGFEIPIFHVNADDPAACVAAARLAAAFRTRFRKDVLIDLVGYRRWGHNEGDEPGYTQPILYRHIGAHPTARALWAETLEREGLLEAGRADALLREAIEALREVNRPRSVSTPDESAESGHGSGATGETPTAVSVEQVVSLNDALLAEHEGVAPHERLASQVLLRRRGALGSDGTIDWAEAETLAFAAILTDGVPIRLTGQDTQRGTFSQRHLMLHDHATGHSYAPLQVLPQARAAFAVHNSPLSEIAALGFEYGYSIHAPETLVLWEAQFGDFVNVAQVILDQFIVAARAKWRQNPSLVLLLPHGYEGQGPEHSSGRLERYLQLAAQDNIRVAYPSTAGQYFHLLRRQAALLQTAPRPLIVMTPKSLLRHPLATSHLEDLAHGRFQPVLDDAEARERPDEVARLILCSGKVYVDLVSSEARTSDRGVAVARVEQLYPFPANEIGDLLAAYPRLREVVWVQEEPQNMGAWNFAAPRLRQLVGRAISLSYNGRPERASPAVGSGQVHKMEQARIVADAFAGVRALQRDVQEVVKHGG